MQILYFLEKIRNPFLDAVFSAVTYLGDEIAFMVVAMLLFWCINKRSGYFMLISGFFGILLNQVLKLICKIPRPWVRDPSFTIVESAREAASGYSFPSGHSQNAASVAGAIFLTTKKLWLKITVLTLAVLVLISRMYLGVHTFWDVIAGGACAVIVLLILEPVFVSDKLFGKIMPFVVAALAAFSVAFYIYAVVVNRGADVGVNEISALKQSKTLLGCALGLILVYTLDRFVIKFETAAPWYIQIVKVVVGFAVVMAIKVLLASLLDLVF